jgi:hypothetical protein
VPFVPQRALAFGRARRLALAVVVVAVAGVVAWFLW